MALLQVVGVSKLEKENFTLKDIHFTQQPSQKIAIAGETGSGKTTLLKMIAGLIQPDSGEIIFEGKRVLGPIEKLIPGHRGIAYLSQHFELRNNYRVEEELESKNLLTEDEANKIYSVCRIQHLLKRKTNQLSGGERQRIVLARLLTTSPRLLLLDEPFSNLDAVHKNIIKSVIQDISTKLKTTCIMVSHDAQDILSWADRILVMKDGEIIQTDTPRKIYDEPINEYCAGLFGEYNLLNKKNVKSFTPAPEQQVTQKKIIVRPEYFSVEKENDYTIKGKVQDVFYFGSYYMLNVLVGGQVLRVKTTKDNFKKEDDINLALRSNVL